eukprot:1188574-Prorocentrum_minimum.AAC.1
MSSARNTSVAAARFSAGDTDASTCSARANRTRGRGIYRKREPIARDSATGAVTPAPTMATAPLESLSRWGGRGRQAGGGSVCVPG